MSACLLEARQLVVEIGGRRVVDRLDLTVSAGERIAILGCNGAGKSTLLATLAGLRPPAGGRVLLGGEDVAPMPARRAALRRAWLGQSQNDPFGSSVLETTLTGRHPHLGRWDWESSRDAVLARGALKAVGLADMEGRQIQTLSGGERQRLAIATLLAQAPRLYLLDEPLAHLDLNHQIATLELLAALAREQQIACVMVLHEPGLAVRFCTHALLLFGDGTTQQGTCDEVIGSESLSRLYGYPLREVRDQGLRWFIPA